MYGNSFVHYSFNDLGAHYIMCILASSDKIDMDRQISMTKVKRFSVPLKVVILWATTLIKLHKIEEINSICNKEIT